MKRGRRIAIIVVALLALSPLLVLTLPRARVALRIVPGFQPLDADNRVYYEPGGEGFAALIAETLPDAVEKIERAHALPFKGDFRVYVSATHRSFTKRLDMPEHSPVRGTALYRDVWVSPNSLDFHGRDTHRQTVAHELSHLHIDQHIGAWRRLRDIPGWFSEGLADWASGTGSEIVSRAEAVEAIAEGRRLQPDSTGRIPPRRPGDYGLSPPMLHQQSLMFVEYLRGKDEQAFQSFVVALLEGGSFAPTFEERFGTDVDGAWNDFLDFLVGETNNARRMEPAIAP
jgi:hypothetical protein